MGDELQQLGNQPLYAIYNAINAATAFAVG